MASVPSARKLTGKDVVPGRPEPVFRPSDNRPRHDAERAERLGIRRFESRRLILYTDIDPAVAATLPPLIDQAYDAWVEYFGELPPNRERTEFQITGYLMKDHEPFIAAGMIPEKLPPFPHGRHRGAEFWMNEQQYDYYRRHLMIHEATHCFMTIVPEIRLPVWYLEGMAELFATHRLGPSGRAEFAVVPDASEHFVGFGRVQMIELQIGNGNLLSLEGVTGLGPVDFSRSFSEPYAWCWALCRFLESHPRYRERFRELGRRLPENRFISQMNTAFAEDRARLQAEWDMFVRTIDYGFDFERQAIEFPPARPLRAGDSIELELASDRGWQPTSLEVEAGAIYRIAAAGRVTLETVPRPWISEPQGITIRYARSRPIGRVVASVYDAAQAQFSEPIDVGPFAEIRPDHGGALYLRVNDFVDDLDNNSGRFHVTIRRVPSGS